MMPPGLLIPLLLGAAPVVEDAASPPRYLDVPTVEAAVAAGAPRFDACASSVEGSALVELVIEVGADGRILAVQVTGVEGPGQRCWEEAARALGLRPHDEEREQIRFSIPVHEGRALPAQDLRLLPRSVLPVLLHLPVHLDPEKRREVLHGLGLEDPPPPPPPSDPAPSQ